MKYRAKKMYGKLNGRGLKALKEFMGRRSGKYRATKNIYYKPSKKRWQWGYK